MCEYLSVQPDDPFFRAFFAFVWSDSHFERMKRYNKDVVSKSLIETLATHPENVSGLDHALVIWKGGHYWGYSSYTRSADKR